MTERRPAVQYCRTEALPATFLDNAADPMRPPWQKNPLTSTESRAARPPTGRAPGQDGEAKSCCCFEYFSAVLDWSGWLYVEFLLLITELVTIVNTLAELGKLECLQGTLLAAREESVSPLASRIIPANGLPGLRTYLGVSLALAIPCLVYFWRAFCLKSEGCFAFARRWRELAGGFGEGGSIFNGPCLCTFTGLAVGVLGYMALSIVRQMEHATPNRTWPSKWCAGKPALPQAPFPLPETSSP